MYMAYVKLKLIASLIMSNTLLLMSFGEDQGKKVY